MRPILPITAIIAFACSATAGPMNVVHLGPPQETNMEVKAGSAVQKFTMPYVSASGLFLLPQKPAVLRTVGDKIKVLNIKAKETGQIAVLHPKGDSFVWTLYESKPSEKKTTLRVINLMEEDTMVIIARNVIEIKAESETPIPEVTRSPVRISFEGGKPISHQQEEPSAVLAFLYKSEGQWKIFYLNDT